MLTFVFLCLVVCAITHHVFVGLKRRREFESFAKARGCARPKYVGVSIWRRQERFRRVMRLKATGEDFIDDIVGEHFQGAVNTIEDSRLDGGSQVVTIEPANIQAILATQFHDFETGHRRYLQMGPILGKSIFTSDGAFWEHSRALFRPHFSRENINDLEATEAAVVDLLEAIGPLDQGGWSAEVDLQPLFFNFTLDTASEFLFGESVRSQKATMAGQQQNRISSTEETASQGASQQFRDDIELIGEYVLHRIRLARFARLGDGLDFRRALGRVKRFTRYFVQRAMKSTEANREGSKKESLLLRLAKQTQDQEELRNQTLAILFAGRDTTAALMGWCFVRLALHQDVYQKLRRVVMEDFAGDEPISFARLKGCRYLQHFINEVLRLHPTVPLNQRTATRDTTLPVGGGPDQKSPIAVAQGEPVGFSVYLMHRRTDLWGEDALAFRPERWLQKVPSWVFLPFSGGPRICLGQQFALTEVSYVLVRVLQTFDGIEPVDGARMAEFRKGLGLTMWPGDGVRVRVHGAKG